MDAIAAYMLWALTGVAALLLIVILNGLSRMFMRGSRAFKIVRPILVSLVTISLIIVTYWVS